MSERRRATSKSDGTTNTHTRHTLLFFRLDCPIYTHTRSKKSKNASSSSSFEQQAAAGLVPPLQAERAAVLYFSRRSVLTLTNSILRVRFRVRCNLHLRPPISARKKKENVTLRQPTATQATRCVGIQEMFPPFSNTKHAFDTTPSIHFPPAHNHPPPPSPSTRQPQSYLAGFLPPICNSAFSIFCNQPRAVPR